MKIPKFRYLLTFAVIISLSACKSDESDDSIADFKAENRKALGVSASDLLSDDIYKNLRIELVYSEGFRPEQETITNFATFLNQRVIKTGGISITETTVAPPQGAPFTTDEIRTIEDDIRTLYTAGDEIAVFIFFANGESNNDTPTSVTLGTAYQNTSIVIYERTLREISASQNIDLSLLESTTLHHEFGHLFGLVNIQNDDVHQNHEDPFQARHCVVEDCLMYFETSTANRYATRNYFNARNQMDVPQFDTNLCIEDLRAKGGR
jgi:hypothetical protein